MNLIIGHGKYEVDKDDFVIYSGAAVDSPEVQTMKKLFESGASIRPPFSYFEFLGEISKRFYTVAISGTHGKSTTTALTSATLAKQHPNLGIAIVGAGLSDR